MYRRASSAGAAIIGHLWAFELLRILVVCLATFQACLLDVEHVFSTSIAVYVVSSNMST